ncbi:MULTISPECIES: hypothetical protein [Geobacillus]|uniref:hypothetical protein n=1 Tax=Geobacillus TaxID=129337 RepID=UPI001F5187BB|nr:MULTISPECIES: hypothetical protein [Geobacillus]
MEISLFPSLPFRPVNAGWDGRTGNIGVRDVSALEKTCRWFGRLALAEKTLSRQPPLG